MNQANSAAHPSVRRRRMSASSAPVAAACHNGSRTHSTAGLPGTFEIGSFLVLLFLLILFGIALDCDHDGGRVIGKVLAAGFGSAAEKQRISAGHGRCRSRDLNRDLVGPLANRLNGNGD